ncbi:hypothetical protein LSAT2_008136 [Lamellibrachia satsuma]|nr:hypothetical protein LSAT2_008136 [Lamellibrachia satsuma]
MGNDVQKHRRWDHPPLIGNFRSRSKSLIRSENDDHAYVDDLPLIQGYLYWLQSSAEWQRRWCVLKGNVLYRLATPSSDDVIDNFKLDVWAVKRWDSGTLHRRPFCCELIYDEFCSEFFSTDSEGELLIWLNRLERVTGCPAETTSSGLARRKTVTGATQPLHSTVRRVHSADSPFLQQQQQQLARDRLWLQKQQLLEEVLTQKTALERQQRKTILGRSCQKRQDTPSECSSNYDVAADTDILWHLRMKKTATKLKINDLERHLEACQEKTKYDMFKQDRPTTESSLIDEIDAVMTTDDLYRRLAELKLELAETDHDLKGFHYKALRNGQSMFLSQGNLNSHSLGCRCIYGKCDTGHEMRETRCRPERVAATSCINLTGVNTPHATIAATSPNEDGVQHNVQHNARQRLTRKPPPFSGLTPRRAYSLRDSLVPQPTPSNSGPTISSSIIRKPTFALAKAPVRRCDSDSAYTVTKNNRYPVIRPGPNGDVQRCWSPQQSTPFSKKECRPRIHGHAPLRRLAQTLGSCSIATYRDNLSVSPSGSHQENARNDPDEKKIVSTTLSKEQDYNSNVSTNLTLHSKEQDYSTKDDRSHRRQDSDARNDTITTYDSGVGTMSDNQDNRVDGPGSGWRESTDAPQTSWLRRRSASITGHLGVLPSKLKAFMPSKAHANDGWASDDNKRLSNPLATRVGDVDIDALSSKYKLRRATEGHRADAEHRNNGDCRRHGVLVDDTLTRTSNIGDKDDVDVAVLRDDVRRNHRVVPPGENGGRDCTVHRCRAVSNIGYSRQRSSSGGDIVTMNNISDTPSIRSHNTVKCGPSADFALVARKDTPHRRVTRSDVSPWTTAVDTKSRGSVCHHCGTVVSCGSERTHERMQERTQAPRCCTNGGDVTTPEISVEAMAHIAAFEKLIDDQLGLMSAARL